MPHSPEALKAIERAISRERLKRYLAAAGNDLRAAVILCEQNIALSEAVFGLLHGLEVAIRNRIAHHEPVLTARQTLYAGSGILLPLNALTECAGWIGPELATWLATSYRYEMAASILDQLAASGIAL
jgi:hypothetical protein